jgi:hypothetical protein
MCPVRCVTYVPDRSSLIQLPFRCLRIENGASWPEFWTKWAPNTCLPVKSGVALDDLPLNQASLTKQPQIYM